MMRFLAFAVLWLSLIYLTAFWVWIESVYQDASSDIFLITLKYRFKLPDLQNERRFNPQMTPKLSEKELDLIKADVESKYKQAKGLELYLHKLWRESSILLFGLVFCATGWVTLSPPPGESRLRTFRGKMTLLSMTFSLALANVVVIAFLCFPIIETGLPDEFNWVLVQNMGLIGAISGAVIGAIIGAVAGAGLKLSQRRNPEKCRPNQQLTQPIN
jgi:hypothetical protein